MRITLIAALSENQVIGKANGLPWHLPMDEKFFLSTVAGQCMIVGRSSYEARTKLPAEQVIIVTRQKGYTATPHQVVHTLDEAFKAAEAAGWPEVWVTGGGVIYKETIGKADRLLLTEVHVEVSGDTYFPEFDQNEWQEVWRETYPANETHDYSFSFTEWVRA